MSRSRLSGLILATVLAGPALADDTLRIAMTASDVPTTTGAPNNGFEGVRFLGYPAFEGLVLWDLSPTGKPAVLRPGLAERWEQDPADKKTWIFHLRPGVTFHDGTPLDADAVIWNLDRFFKIDSPQFEAAGSGLMRARVPIMGPYRKVDAMTVAISTTTPASYFPFMSVYILFTSQSLVRQAAGRDWGEDRGAAAGRHRAVQAFQASYPAQSPPSLAKPRGLLGPQARVPKLSTASCCCRCRRRIPALPRSAAAKWTGSRCRRRMPSPA